MSRSSRSPSRRVIVSASDGALGPVGQALQLQRRVPAGPCARGDSATRRVARGERPRRPPRAARQVVGGPGGPGKNGGGAACLTAERLPAGRRRVAICLGRQRLGFRDARGQGRARLGQQGAHLMPFPARGDRLGEALCQTVGLRAITDERQERSPLFFDRNQLFEDVFAVERLDARAERVAGRDGLGAQARPLGGLLGFTHTARDRHLDRGGGLGETRDRRGGSSRPRPCQASREPRQFGAHHRTSATLASCSMASTIDVSRRRRSSSAARAAASAASIS